YVSRFPCHAPAASRVYPLSLHDALPILYRASEMTIWFASGVPLSRFVGPVLQTSWPVLLLIAVLSLFVWPWQNERSQLLKDQFEDRKSTRLNSSHQIISYAVFCLKKKKQ